MNDSTKDSGLHIGSMGHYDLVGQGFSRVYRAVFCVHSGICFNRLGSYPEGESGRNLRIVLRVSRCSVTAKQWLSSTRSFLVTPAARSPCLSPRG